MENTTATTLYDTAALDDIARQDADLDGLNSHEIAHQWFGDLITCKTWEHIWLNEGWATYATSLWLEDRDGYNEGYLRNLYGQVRGLARRDQLQPGSTHIRPGMASPVYGHPWEVFRRTSNPYPKGAAVLHMLRMKLGEDLFFDAIAEYLDRYKNTSVETDDFRTTLEDVSGLSLEHFFDQWVIRPGTPNVQIDAHWDDAAGELRLTVAQQQRIDQLHPAFVFDLPIHIYTDPSTEPTVVTIPVSRRTHERAVSLPAEPAMVVIDPHLSVLMALTTDMPTDWLHAQARRAPTLSARMEAAEFLADHASPKTARTLRDILTNTAEHWSVRQQAARSLGELGEADALTAILGSGDIENPKVRRAVVEGLAAAVTPSSNDADRAIDLLAMHAGSAERSYACRTAALEAIGRLGSMQRHRAVIEDALAFDSQHDQVRRGALRALANFNHSDGIELAAPFTRFGHLSRLRPVAIDAVAELAHHDRDRAFAIIQPIVLSSGDGETRALRAAIEALVVVKHSAGIDTLERFASRTKHPVRKQDALDARDRLAAALRSDDRGAPTAEALERLQRQINDLRDELAQQKGPATPN
jgi:aminopeptidase N